MVRTPLSSSVLVLACATIGLYVFTCFYLQPPFDVAGDAPGYLQAMHVLNGDIAPPNFTANRLLTTFGGVSLIAFLSSFTGLYLATWFFVNTLCFFGLAFASFFLFRRLTGSNIGSVLGALFVVGNYDVLVFGLNYLMDIQGWFFFVLSLLSLSIYIESREEKHLWWAALIAGVGTVFKEYAFFALLPIALYLLYEHWREPAILIRKGVICAVSLLPLLFIHVSIYFIYGYTYLDWYGMNTATFGFAGWAWNAGRSFLVVLSFLVPLMLLGAYELIVRARMNSKQLVFVLSLILPGLAVFLWPVITERLVFLFIPFAALLAAFAIARYERHWPWFGLIWLLYVMVALRTDGLILNALYGS